MVLKRLFLTLCFFFLSLSFVLADETRTFDLGEVVVVKGEGMLSSTPATSFITSGDIEAKNAQSIDEALDFMPGIRLTIGQKNEPYVMLRGFNQDKVLILLDGIPIASPYYGYVDLNQIPTESIAKVKVIKGLASPLYGANAIGGVINIVSKKAGEKPYLDFNTDFSDRSTQHYSLSWGAKSKDLSVWLSASHRESDGFKLSRDFKETRNENGGLRENSYYEKDAFSLKLGLEKDESHNLTAFFHYIDNEKGIPPHATSSDSRDLKYWRFTEWKRWMLALANEYKIKENLSLKARIFYDKYDNTIKKYDDATYTTQSNGWTSIYDEYALGGSVYFDFNPNEMHFLKGAVNFKKDVHKEQDDAGDPWETYEIRTYSLGLEDDIALSEKLSLSIGSSFDLFDQIRAYTENKGGDIYSFNPLVVIDYSLTPETLIYSSLAKRTSFPTINQLFSSTSGNPDLNEQRNVNYEAGIRQGFKDKALIEASYFYNNVKDLIERASKNDRYLNTSKAVFEGIETNIQTKMGKCLSGRIGYTYLDARDKNPALFGRLEEELANIPKHKADMELNFVTDFGLSCNLLGSYHGRRYYYDSANAQHALGGYAVYNTNISQRFLENWEAGIYIENIFNRNYQEEEGYPQPGRSFLFSIKGRF